MLLDLDGRGPRYAQITRALLSLIQGGVLAPGARMPGTRELAHELACSRNIVLLAYEQLTLAGYLEGRPKAGTFVSPALPRRSVSDVQPRPSAAALSLSPRGRRLGDGAAYARPVTGVTPGMPINFMYGMCEPDDRLVVRLRASLGKALRARAFGYIDAAGDLGLRQQVADRLRAARGILREPAQIIITSGAQQALDICARLLVGDGDGVVVEDPGYAAARALFASAGGAIIPIPVDDHGLNPEMLPDDDRPIRAVYVTPSHQFPTGAVMPVGRRYALLEWAKQRGACIIEDDYDGELRYIGRPIKALAGLDGADQVIYCGTFSKSLFPSLRLAYLAVPEWLVADTVNVKWLMDRGCSALLQQPLCDLMASGEYDRHISRMLRRYRARRLVLMQELRRHLGADIRIQGDGAGLHLVVWTPNLNESRLEAVRTECQRRGIGVYSIAPHAAHRLPQSGLILGYGVVDERQIREGVSGLASAYRHVAGAARQRRHH